MKKAAESVLLLPHGKTAPRQPSTNQDLGRPGTASAGTMTLHFLTSTPIREKLLLFISHLHAGFTHSSLNGRRHDYKPFRNRWQFLNKFNFTYHIISSSTSRHLLERNDRLCPYKDLYTNVRCGFIRNSQKLETTQMPISR